MARKPTRPGQDHDRSGDSPSRYAVHGWSSGSLPEAHSSSQMSSECGVHSGFSMPGDLQFVLLQRAVAVGADVFDPRPPELQHPAPGPGFHRHAQAAQAHAAAVALVPHDEVQRGRPAAGTGSAPRRCSPGCTRNAAERSSETREARLGGQYQFSSALASRKT